MSDEKSPRTISDASINFMNDEKFIQLLCAALVDIMN
jgi:hypothetical protein